MSFVTIMLFAVMVTISCTNSNNQVTPAVSFKKDIIPIFTTYCALNSQCHSGSSNYNHYLNLDSSVAYQSIINSKDGLLSGGSPSATLFYVEIAGTSPSMPKYPNPPLSTAQQNLILDWITQGAKNN